MAATVAPMMAAAMLSRNADSTNTSASSTKPPFQSSGRKRGIRCGTWLSSKCRDSSAKPTSSANRLVRITHSSSQVPQQAEQPGLAVEVSEEQLVGHDGREAEQRDLERVPMKQRHAEQREAEQQELDRELVTSARTSDRGPGGARRSRRS